MSAPRAVILDIDGTLVDSNDAHAQAWVDALGEAGFDVPFERVRPLIGMGGDKLLPVLIDRTDEAGIGKRIAERRSELFAERYLPRLRAFPGARALLERLRHEGVRRVVASSAKQRELGALLDVAGVADLVEHATGGDEVDASKPDPDAIEAALGHLGLAGRDCLMVGDTPYDIEAATRAGVRTIAVRSGGWPDAALAEALVIYDDVGELLRRFEESPFRPAGRPCSPMPAL